MTPQPTGLPATHRRRLATLLLASSVSVVALASCSQNDEGSVSAEAPVTVDVSPLPATSLPPATVAPTEAPTTAAPTTTLPLLTLPPTTLPAPTTTAAPTTTIQRNVEVDKDRQLLFIVRDGMTIWTFNTSTATGQPYREEDKNTPGEFQEGVSITPNGLWKVNRERPEGWWEGDLGQIYRPKYFRGGVAVHGSNSIPNYPASHGCVRVSVPAMDFIWDQDLMPMKSVVWVHGNR